MDNNGLFYCLGDHPSTSLRARIEASEITSLSSTSALTKGSDSYVVGGSIGRYAPYGAYRTTPTQTVTDRLFTGHKHNDDLGLVYMNARFYVPSVGRFVSADTLVPDPANPQSFNRYSYVLNRPLNFTDPTGHRVCGASDDCSDPLPHTSAFQDALLRSWIYYEDNFDLLFEETQNMTQGFGPNHDGIDWRGDFAVRSPASGVVAANAFRDPPAGMWMVQNQATGEIRTWSRWYTDPGWQGELTESDRGEDGLLEPERLLSTGKWTDIRDGWSHSPGTMIKVNHGHNLATTYIHTVPALEVGQQVEVGDVLGNTANNGWSSGTHLHYRLEFTHDGRTIYLNPLAPPRAIAHLLP